jgi:hypothetical protein
MNDELSMDLQKCGSGLFHGSIPAFIWKKLGNPQNPSIRIVSNVAEIFTSYLINAYLKHYCHITMLSVSSSLFIYSFITKFKMLLVVHDYKVLNARMVCE